MIKLDKVKQLIQNETNESQIKLIELIANDLGKKALPIAVF